MFKRDKRPADNTSAFYNGSSSPLVERKDKVPSPISSNFQGVNKEIASALLQSTTEPVSWDTLDPSSVYDVPINAATTAKSSTVTRQSKPVVSSSTLQPSALQASYKQGAQSASTAAHQIQVDKMEVIHIIANYAVEPLEMLHLGK
ncbi:unnamed protein product [Rotaria sp. Silwood2]|nr:unnamed protein product [Rotaria sp. Silwood2]CAF3228406.1 unnamed protein product [Rotaria sp. Silwood2]CAF4212728.1 unnamed protein product [Rotaria sp. Silwood2]CAF4347293.1 unnamed protein product [Rotaria sp. Silwood2]